MAHPAAPSARTPTLRSCYLHCGPHKTGSTTLQHIMDARGDLLLARKLFVPVLARGCTPSRSHVGLIPELRHLVRGDRPTPRWNALRTILSRTRLTPVISSEIFSLHFLKADELAAAIHFLQDCGRRPHFIYYLRDQPSWINSTYVQDTKNFYTSLSFADYLDQACANPRFDYGQMLGQLIGNPAVDPADAEASGKGSGDRAARRAFRRQQGPRRAPQDPAR